MKWPPSLQKILKVEFEHKELVFWFVGLLVFVIFYSQIFLLPPGRRAQRLREEIKLNEKRYQEVLGGQPLEEVILSLRRESMVLEETLPRQERISAILTALSNEANGVGIEVISVRPEPAVPYPNAENPIRLEGKVCQSLSIQMELRASYRVLGGYLASLEREFPSTVTIDGIEIQQEGGESSFLKITLFITTYLFETPS